MLPRSQWLLIGDWSLPAVQNLRDFLLPLEPCMRPTLRTVMSDAALTVQAIDFVVVYQSFPDEYPASDVERAIGLWPLARWIVCYGDWCTSQGRSEAVWPIGWCVSLPEAAARLEFEQRAFECGVPPLSATASRDEAFASMTSMFST